MTDSAKPQKLASRELTRVLSALATANKRAAVLREKIASHSVAVYGVDPADVDCDEFIDACDAGGCGIGMTAKEFDDGMRLALSRGDP